jgi:hypothetical protein
MIDQTTILLTACGRPDLLAHTLRTLNAAHPLADFAAIWVNEDEPATDNSETRDLFPFINWLYPEGRGGHMAALDRLYREVKTPWIFHCEEDWEFYGGPFLAESYERLKHDPRCLQVWLRAHNDTNGHAVFRTARGYVMSTNSNQSYLKKKREWRGFSLNPGLRRAKEFANYNFLWNTRGLTGWRAEKHIGELFFMRGYHAAITSNPLGYVRHTGGDRHKEDQAQCS